MDKTNTEQLKVKLHVMQGEADHIARNPLFRAHEITPLMRRLFDVIEDLADEINAITDNQIIDEGRLNELETRNHGGRG